MKIAIGSDHGGFALKTQLVDYLKNKNYEVSDEGTYSEESCDYPVFAKKAARKAASGECDFGVLVCTSGIGMSIAANKVKGARAALIRDAFDAEMSRRHNDANVICFG
ncbi:MAG: ribose 5-phosphate isomerase B, partial [Eubacteriales bacterium]|nr:ribose 5-phosphate isomerase B [Eubacteriales bacterium]